MQKKPDTQSKIAIRVPTCYEISVEGTVPATTIFRVYAATKEDALRIVQHSPINAEIVSQRADLKKFKPKMYSVKNLIKNTIELVKRNL